MQFAALEVDWRVVGDGVLGLAACSSGFSAGAGFSVGGSEVYGFADTATVTREARLGFLDQDYDLASAGGGVRLSIGPKTGLGLEGAYGLEDPRPGRDGRWRLGVNLAVRR